METSLEVQPDDMMGRHRDGEHNPLERPQASEKESQTVTDGTSHLDQGRDFVFQTEVGMDLETSQVTAHHFELVMFRQQATTSRSTDRGEDYSIQADFAENSKQGQQHGSPPVRRLRSAGNSEGRRRLSRASSLILWDEG